MQKKIKTLMVLAHPDDEIIFGWPVLQNHDIEKKILICSSDLYNPEREWCKHRKEALYEVGRHVNAEVICLDYPSGFYRSPTRPQGSTREEDGQTAGPYRSLCKYITERILTLEQDCDSVFTHNPYGEYGHLDHQLIFNIVLRASTKPIIITDIFQPSNWAALPSNDQRIKDLYYSNRIEADCVLDEDLLRFCKKEYKKKNSWTWSKEVVQRCNLYEL